MAEFTKSDPESIRQHAEATRTPLIVETVARQDVGDRFKMGWRPLSPFISMTPPSELNDDMEPAGGI